MQNFCPKCGHRVKNTDNVCGNCGTPLKNNQSNINREVTSRFQQPQPNNKKHSAYKWVIGVCVVALLAGGGYLVYQNTASANNSVAMKKTPSKTSSKKSDSAQSKSSATNSSNNSDDEQSSTEENDNQEDINSNDDRESTASSRNQENDDNNETMSDVGPKTAASSILLLGAKKSKVWKGLATQDKLEINVIPPKTGTPDNYSEPGTGVSYSFSADDRNYGESVLEYRISRDETTVYCYEQPMKDSYDRHVTPFATLSAKEIQQVKNSPKVKDLVDRMEVKAN